MSQNQIPNPYTSNRTIPAAPGTPTAPGVSIGAASPSALGVIPDPRLANAFLTQAFLWMFAGLLVSAAVAFTVQSNAAPARVRRGQLLPAVHRPVRASWSGISRGDQPDQRHCGAGASSSSTPRRSGSPSGSSWRATRAPSVVPAFLSASAMFGAAAVYGQVTQRSLAALGGILFMGLIGLLVAMFLNIFLHSSEVTWIISIVGVGLFTALTAYDVQRIQSGDLAAQTGSMEKAAVIGALSSTWTSSTCSCSCSGSSAAGARSFRRCAAARGRPQHGAASVPSSGASGRPRGSLTVATAGIAGAARVDALDRLGDRRRPASTAGSGRANR